MSVEFREPTIDDALEQARRAMRLGNVVMKLLDEPYVNTQAFLDAIAQAHEACVLARITCDWVAGGKLT